MPSIALMLKKGGTVYTHAVPPNSFKQMIYSTASPLAVTFSVAQSVRAANAEIPSCADFWSVMKVFSRSMSQMMPPLRVTSSDIPAQSSVRKNTYRVISCPKETCTRFVHHKISTGRAYIHIVEIRCSIRKNGELNRIILNLVK